jgi:hypothetical protein
MVAAVHSGLQRLYVGDFMRPSAEADRQKSRIWHCSPAVSSTFGQAPANP